jgi:hypothetical protein
MLCELLVGTARFVVVAVQQLYLPGYLPAQSGSRAIPLLPLWAYCGLLWGDLYLYMLECLSQMKPVRLYLPAPSLCDKFLALAQAYVHEAMCTSVLVSI